MINPLPAIIVSCGDSVENSNLITVAWVGTICSDPAMCYISVRPSRQARSMAQRVTPFSRQA